MIRRDSPARRWAEHHYTSGQRDWLAELLNDPPDWSALEDLHQTLCSLEAYLVRLDHEDL